MNMFVSIFGGMLLTAILFAAVRAVRRSNFWAAVTAAAVPSFAYMGYSLVDWPGLDVLTMHIVAFPTVALLLFQIGGTRDAPYQPIHWVPKLLIAFFMVVTVVLGSLVYIAGHGVPPAVAHWLLPDAGGKTLHTGFAGVVAHGEEASKSIAHYRNMDKKLSRLGWHVEVDGLDVLRPGQPGDVRVLVSDKDARPVSDVSVNLDLGRPGQMAEQQVMLQRAGDGSYQARVTLASAGEWLAVLVLERDGETMQFERILGNE
jgi:nitrogen fixation protein FixH